MMKTSLIKAYVTLITIILVSTLPTIASYADQNIIVDPLVINFGEVEIGSTSTAMIDIGNMDGHLLFIYEIVLLGSLDFGITSAPNFPILVNPGDWIILEVVFTPSSTGQQTATVEITSDDPEKPTVQVSLVGEGVPQGAPPASVADILAFYDASVADGALVGCGPGGSAEGRLNALRNMIEAAGDLIEDGSFEEACQQLLDAYRRCDGLPRPPEFVAGPASLELACMILELHGSICD